MTRTPASPSRRNALVALILLTLIWSYNWIVMKQALRYCGPFEFTALRSVFGTVVVFALLMLRRASPAPPPLLPTILIGLVQAMGFPLLVQWALVEGGAGKTALLAYTMPFWLVIVSWLLWSERPSLRLWLGLGIAGAGLLLVLEPWHGFANTESPLIAIAAGLLWALGVALSKRLFMRGVGALSLTAWSMLFGSIGLVVVALAVDERTTEWSGYLIGALVYNAVLASGLAWLLWSFVVERLPATVAGLSSLVIPIAGIGLAWMLLGEQPSALESVGIGLIAGALALVALQQSAGRRDPTQS